MTDAATWREIEVEAAVILMEMAVEAENEAVRHGIDPERFPPAPLGDALLARRAEQGSYALRQTIMALTADVQKAWDAVFWNPIGEVFDILAFDFDFCPKALELHFLEELDGQGLIDGLIAFARNPGFEVVAIYPPVRGDT